MVINPKGLEGTKYIKTVSKRLCGLSIIFNDIIIYFFCVFILLQNHTDIRNMVYNIDI